MFKKTGVFLSSFVIFLLLLNGCTGFISDTQPESKPAVYHKATFYFGDLVFSEQMVEQGNAPAVTQMRVSGLNFIGWADQTGAVVDISQQLLSGDTSFYAVAYPELHNHVPFLFSNSDGMLCPDEPLTSEALSKALHALASDGAEVFFPELSTENTAVSTEELRDIMSNFYPLSSIDEVIPKENTTVTRRKFAAYICTLLGRTADEKIQLSDGAVVSMDVNIDAPDYVALLEASVAHTPDTQGTLWSEADLPTGLEPGFTNIQGWLYYVQEDGRLLRNSQVGALTFGEDGRYTCGDAELDQIVADVLHEILSANPDAERIDLLRKAYEYCRDSFTYLRKDPYGIGATGWEIADGKKMFLDKRGNCYYFAGAFWALAQGLGYEARAISGTCTGTDQPHAWVIIAFDGVDYFFDPQWENNYHTREIYDKDMFMLSLDRVWWWNYKWIH